MTSRGTSQRSVGTVLAALDTCHDTMIRQGADNANRRILAAFGVDASVSISRARANAGLSADNDNENSAL